ncbi:SEC-C metal-binding domain-containing protein [Klebsiella variicola]
MAKIGRNDSCWCGSGKKYKRCHLGREREKNIDRGEAIQFLIYLQM